MSKAKWWPPPPHITPPDDNVKRLLFLHDLDGRPIAVTSEGSCLTIRDLPDGSVLQGPLQGHTDVITALSVGEINGRPAIASGDFRGCVRLWDLVTGEQLGDPLQNDAGDGSRAARILALAIVIFDGFPAVISVQPTGRSTRIWNLTTRAPAKHGLDISDEVLCLAAFGDYGRGHLALATAGHEHGVRVWNPLTGALLAHRIPPPCKVDAVAFARLLADHVLLVAHTSATDGSTRFVSCFAPGAHRHDPFATAL